MKRPASCYALNVSSRRPSEIHFRPSTNNSQQSNESLALVDIDHQVNDVTLSELFLKGGHQVDSFDHLCQWIDSQLVRVSTSRNLHGGCPTWIATTSSSVSQLCWLIGFNWRNCLEKQKISSRPLFFLRYVCIWHSLLLENKFCFYNRAGYKNRSNNSLALWRVCILCLVLKKKKWRKSWVLTWLKVNLSKGISVVLQGMCGISADHERRRGA